MKKHDTGSLAVYELPNAGLPAPTEGEPAGGPDYLPETLLVRNVHWFCQLRWLVAAILVAVGVMAAMPGITQLLSLRERIIWPFVLAGILVFENLVFLAHYRRLVGLSARGIRLSLWGQIVVDLLVLTAVVHYTGSMETYVHFAYLFHIVLACIFFPRRNSLAVTLTACALYGICIALEETGLWPPESIFASSRPREWLALTPSLEILNVVSAVGIIMVVWYLASYLSAMVRRRDRELVLTNRRLVQARDERMRHMLHTTHQIKAPFAAIHANTQLLLKGYCGELAEPARQIVQKISARSSRLADEIQEMLQLANLSSQSQRPPEPATLDLAEVLRWCVGQVQAKARARGISIDENLSKAKTTCVEEHLKMLFINLLSNAVAYSYEGGRVRIACRGGADGRPVAVVVDNGIGIEPEKLPRIFDQHYRTAAAARHNKESSGLGLAIVRHIAEMHALGLRVESRMGEGTKFEVTLPPGETALVSPTGIKEPHYGQHTDS